MKIFLQNALWSKVSLLRQTSQYSGSTLKADYLIHREMMTSCDYVLLLDPRLPLPAKLTPHHVDHFFHQGA